MAQENWNVADWLRSLGLEQYGPAFRDNDIDAEVLRELTGEDLQELGVSSVGHRRKLLAAIAELSTHVGGKGEDPPAISAVEPESQPHDTRTQVSPIERRQLTVMFCDLVGSAALSNRLDPEDLRELLRTYQNAVAAEIARFEGYVAQFLGDGVLAFFGYPRAHEDDAERAVHAGLKTIEALARLRTQAGAPLAARVGIATGLVVSGDIVGKGVTKEDAVVGETPNLAARLQALAEPNAILIAGTTRRLIAEAFALEALPPQFLKGFGEPVEIWRVVGTRKLDSRFEAHATGLAPLVGRDQEIALILARWEQSLEGEGQVVLLSGEPGIGKSRITRAVLEQVEPGRPVRLRYQCSPYYTNTAFSPIIDQLERAAGFTRDDTALSKLDKLEALLSQGTAQPREVVPLIASLLSIPTERRFPPLTYTPQRQKELTIDALVGQLLGLAARQPVLAIFEDVHWADPTTLEVLDQIIDRIESARVLLLVTFRPEFVPQWRSRSSITAHALTRLGRRQSAALISKVTGGKELPSEVLDQILAKTDGVPLFVEELTKTVLESGLLREDGKKYVLSGPLPPLAIPSTLQDSLMSRLDRLAPVKEVAQLGAVIGREFSYELLATLTPLRPPELQAALTQLATSELVFARGTPPEATYTFKHALVQDTAYESLLKSRRQQLHARIAEVLVGSFPDAAAANPEVVAHHYNEARLTEPAIRWWTKAGQKAADQSAIVEALATLQKALALIDNQTDRTALQAMELEVLSALGPVAMAAYGYQREETSEFYARARRLCSQSNDAIRVCSILYGSWVNFWMRGLLRDARDVVVEFEEVSRRSNDLGLKSAAHCMSAQQLSAEGKLVESVVEYRSCIDLYDPERDRAIAFRHGEHPTSVSRSMGGFSLWFLGYPDQAMDWAQEGVRLAQEASHVNTFCHSLDWVGMIQLERGEHEAALRTWATLEAHGREQNLAHWSLRSAGFSQGILFLENPNPERHATATQALGAFRGLGHGVLDAPCALLLANAYLKAPNLGDAMRTVDEVIAAMQLTGESWYLPELYRVRGEALAVKGRSNWGEACASFEMALEIARSQEAKSLELRAAIGLARLWAETGERQRAQELLSPIFAWFAEGFSTGDLIRAKALLDEVA